MVWERAGNTSSGIVDKYGKGYVANYESEWIKHGERGGVTQYEARGIKYEGEGEIKHHGGGCNKYGEGKI